VLSPPSRAGLSTHLHRTFAALVRSRHVTASARFVGREALGRRRTAQYALREAPRVQVVLRHATPDLEVFDEIFVQRLYALPPAVERALGVAERALRGVDAGANVGLFAAWVAARWPEAQITCIEPDPCNLPILERANAANGGRWRIVAAAAGVADGETAFLAGRFATSRAVAAPAGAAVDAEMDATIDVPVRDVLGILAAADLVKLDIEGGEWPILADPRLATHLRRVCAVALEFHPHGCPAPDARREAARLLRRAGFAAVQDVPTRAPRGYGSLWAWRPREAVEPDAGG
jgi:FkbM family methyltransferase